MAQQTINIGATANDGTGDSLRTAGPKINANFTELYAAAAPAIIHGTIDLSKYPGVVLGAVSGAQRTTNGTAMQAAFDEAATNEKYVEAPDGRYEYTASRVQTGVPRKASDGGGTTTVNVGLQVPPECPGLHGNFKYISTVFVQHATDHPALTLGSGNGEVKATGTEYRGITTTFGSGLTLGVNSRGFLIGAQFQSKFDQLRYDKFEGGGNVKPYIGWDHVNHQGSWFFSCQVGTLFIDAGQQHVFRVKVNGTGNTFDNLYIGRDEGVPGTPAPPTVNGAIFVCEDGHQGTFRQLNLEWQNSSNLMRFVNTRGVVIDSLHIEGCNLIGANPSAIYNEISSINLRSVQLFDMGIDSGKGMTGTANLFQSWGDCQTRVETLDGRWHVNAATPYGYANMPFRLYQPAGDADQKPIFHLDNMYLQNYESTFDIDSTLPAATFGDMSEFGSYRWNRSRSRTEDGTFWAISGTGNVTVYGAHRHSRVRIWEVLTANRNVILSDRLAPSGFGSTVPVEIGDTREILRESGATGGFSVLVRNPANTTTVATLASAGATVLLTWNGTAWVAA